MEGLRTKKDLYFVLRNAKRDINDFSYLYDKIREKIHITPENSKQLTTSLKNFAFKLKQRWVAASYTEYRFLQRNKKWLESNYTYPGTILQEISSTSGTVKATSTVPLYKGRKLSSNCSRGEKVRRIKSLVKKFSLNELLYATKMSLRKHGMHHKAKALRRLGNNGLCERTLTRRQKRFTVEQALSIFTMADLSKFQYITMRNESIRCNINPWPSYHKLLIEKSKCYPPKNKIEISETHAKIDLQCLLDHTVSRIIKSLNTVIDNTELTLLCKWGCDGATGLPRYKQIQNECCDMEDEAIFISSVVPLRLENKLNSEIIWENSTPSPWYCRPIRFRYVKQSKDIVNEEIDSVNMEIENLVPYNVYNTKIEYIMMLTMVDNKVCNSMTTTSSTMQCYICQAEPIEMNDLNRITSSVCSTDNYAFGISSLHMWIRCMECLLDIAYNLPFKKWTANTADLKKKREERKKELQEQLKRKMGLYIDYAKQGWGSSNDGHTARKFFSNAEITAEVTGIDIQLIKRFHIILQVISSPYKIDTVRFQRYTQDTAKHYVQIYGWYYMPASIHKLLIHGADFIKNVLLPIGQLPEETQEMRQKGLKRTRCKNTRRNSRISTNGNILNRLLVTSDPYISSIRIKSYSKSVRALDADAIELINNTVQQ